MTDDMIMIKNRLIPFRGFTALTLGPGVIFLGFFVGDAYASSSNRCVRFK